MSWNGKAPNAEKRTRSSRDYAERAAGRERSSWAPSGGPRREDARTATARADDRPPHLVVVISEHKKRAKDVAQGCRRVMAIVRYGKTSGRTFTKHIDIDQNGNIQGWK